MKKEIVRTIILGLMALIFWAFTPSEISFSQDSPKELSQNKASTSKKGHQRSAEERFSLNMEQRKKMRQIRQKYEGAMEDLGFDLQRKRFEVADMLRLPEPNREQIDKKIDELLALERKRHKLILDEYFEVRKILTPEQNRFFLRRIVRAMLEEK